MKMGKVRSAAKRLRTGLLVVAVLLSLGLWSAPADAASSGGGSDFAFVPYTNESVNSWSTIKSKASVNNGTVIYQLTGNINADSECTVTGDLTIDLNGHTITASSSLSWKHVMTVNGGGKLTITDSAGSGKFTTSSSVKPFSLVKVDGGNFTLDGGTLENSKGGYHAIQMNSGTTTINGGTIQNSGVANTDHGGGISVASGDLTINGGTIKNNKAKTGAGIQFQGGGNFTMTGGSVTKNTASSNGGGLYFKDCAGEIKFEGGSVTENTATWHGGGLWFDNCGNVDIGGDTHIDNNSADTAGGIRVQNGTNLTITGGTVSKNTASGTGASDAADGLGGGIAVTQSTITITGGEISGNTAKNGGGGIALRQGDTSHLTTVTMSGGTISDNSVTGGEWKYGGGVYLQDHSRFTMTDGTISGNHSIGQGGGIATDYTGADGKCTGDMKVTINGGTISGNYSTLHEGGGIGMGSGTLVIEAKDDNKIYITENESRTTDHWGGGGIMISDKSQAVIVNALIENNSAGGFGGGLGACSTGHVYYGVGEYEDNPSPLAAIFGNSADGKNLSGGKSKKDADHNAYKNPVFMSSGYQDVYSALEAVISGAMLGGGDEAWVGSADGAPVTVGKDGFVSASQMLGLTSNSNEADRAKAREAASVFITGNKSNTHGGGIMCNGSLAMGWSAELEVTPGLKIGGKKMYEVKGTAASSVPEFKYGISDTEPTWTEDGWKAADGSNVFVTKNGVDGNFAFDLTFGETQPCLKKETGEQTFYFWEVNEGGNGVTYDQSLYKVTVKVSEKTETKDVAGATLTITTWSIDSGSAKVGKCGPESTDYTDVTITQEVEKNNNSSEAMHWTTRTVITLTNTAFTNTYDGNANISIVKVDDSSAPLSGVKFTLYRKDNKGQTIGEWDDKWTKVKDYTSNNDGVIYKDVEGGSNNLQVGTYRIVETETPDGFGALPGYIEFEIKGSGYQRMISCPFDPLFSDHVEVTENGLKLRIENERILKSLRLIKVDGSLADRNLAGAEFELWSTAEGVKSEKLFTGVSGEDGKINWTAEGGTGEPSFDLTLGVGTYHIIETKAPDGYFKLEKPITLTVDKDGKITLQSSEIGVLDADKNEPVLTYRIPNTSGYLLPESGGPGIYGLIAGGLALVLVSAAAFELKKRAGRRAR